MQYNQEKCDMAQINIRSKNKICSNDNRPVYLFSHVEEINCVLQILTIPPYRFTLNFELLNQFGVNRQVYGAKCQETGVQFCYVVNYYFKIDIEDIIDAKKNDTDDLLGFYKSLCCR